jgi:hypothetical protein
MFTWRTRRTGSGAREGEADAGAGTRLLLEQLSVCGQDLNGDTGTGRVVVDRSRQFIVGKKRAPIMGHWIRPFPRLLVAVAIVIAAAGGCKDHSADSKCYDAENLASSDSVSILNTVHVGDDLQVRISGLIGFCSSLRRVDRKSRGDTVILRPISGEVVCPGAVCVPAMRRFVDTVAVPTPRPGRVWVRVEDRYERLVDSTVILPSGAGSR